MADDFKYHIDHHARLLPPPALVAARATAGADVVAAEEAAITAALLEQRRLGLLGLSDGEFRRPTRLSVIHDGIDGFGAPVDGVRWARCSGRTTRRSGVRCPGCRSRRGGSPSTRPGSCSPACSAPRC